MVSCEMFQINCGFIRWKALYFLVAAAQGPVAYFLVNFYLSRGISYEAAGFIESIVPFLGCLCRPLACYFADRYALHRLLLATAVGIYALSLSGFLVLSTRYELIVSNAILKDANNSAGNFSSEFISVNNTLQPTANNNVVLPLLCGLRFLSTIGIAPATSLLDGIIYHSLELSGQSANWGRQRLWGSIGFSLFALLSAFLLDTFTQINYVVGFSLALSAAVALFVVSLVSVQSYKIVNEAAKESKDAMDCNENLVSKSNCETPIKSEVHGHRRSYFGHVVNFIFRDGQILLVAVVASAVGYFSAGRDIFVSPYLESITKTNNKLIVGVMQAILGTVEIPVMFTVGWFLQRIGTMPFFAACFAAFTLRFWLYTLLTADTVWFFLLIELLHIFCFGLVVPAMTFHAHSRVIKRQNSLPQMTTIVQGIVSTLYLGFGYGIGCIAGGVLMQRYSGPTCMLIFSITGAICFIVFVIVWVVIFLVSRSRKNLANNQHATSDNTEQVKLTNTTGAP